MLPVDEFNARVRRIAIGLFYTVLKEDEPNKYEHRAELRNEKGDEGLHIMNGGYANPSRIVIRGNYPADYKGRQVTDLPLAARRKLLEDACPELVEGCIELARQVRIGKKQLYHKAILDPVNEGIVLKKLDSKYLCSTKSCPQNPFWLKVKRPEKHVYIEGGKEE